jgi:O-antigen/teichoic acid export membrane protein
VAVLSALCALLVVPVLIWIGKPIYLDNVHIFYVLLAGVAVFVIGHIPHYSLYAMAQDRVLLKAHLLGFCFFVVSGWILARELQTLGVAIALLLASALMGAYKQWKVHALTLTPKTSPT